MDFKDRKIDKEYFQDLKNKTNHNWQIADFYKERNEETGEEVFFSKSRAVDGCCKYWDVHFYSHLKVKDIQRVNLCKDKFCFNCQSMFALRRQLRFGLILDELRKIYDVYHMVVTVPNCNYDELFPLLKRMYKKFPYIIDYFKGKKKLRNVNFAKYGYVGAVRALEVTKNQDTDEFHPHFHCMILLKKEMNLEQRYINPYSFNRGVLEYKFNELEILLQKVWFLVMNDEKVTAKAIEELALGYDLRMDDSNGYYHEVFKYVCKGAFDLDKGAFIYDKKTFWTLYDSLYNRRMI